MRCFPPTFMDLSCTVCLCASSCAQECIDLPFPVYAYWCMMAMTCPLCVLMTPPAVTIGILLILWLSMPCILTLRLVVAMTWTLSLAIPPFAPRSTSELLFPAWHADMAYAMEAMLTCRYLIPLRLTLWGWASLLSLLEACDKRRLTLPSGRGFFL